MDSTIAGIVAAVVVGILAAIGNYFNNRRGSRGTVKTSQAEDLWQASEGLRHDMADMLKQSNVEMDALRIKLKESEVEADTLRDQLKAAIAEVTELRSTTASLITEVEGLRSQLSTVRRRPGGAA